MKKQILNLFKKHKRLTPIGVKRRLKADNAECEAAMRQLIIDGELILTAHWFLVKP